MVFELEETIRLFLKDAHRIGIPQSQGRARTDVEVYLKSLQISAPKFKNQRPGINTLISFKLQLLNADFKMFSMKFIV